MEKVKVAIIEDHTDFRESLSYILNSSDEFICTQKFPNAEEGKYALDGIDVLVLDINLPGQSGIEIVKEVKERYPEIKIMMLTVFDDDDHLLKAIIEGADGYILKKTPPIQILQAIHDAHQGGAPMSPMMARKTISMFKRYIPKPMGDNDLTTRETEILSMLTDGLSNKEISERIYISQETVRNHIRHIYTKLRVHSKTQAVARAIKEGLV